MNLIFLKPVFKQMIWGGERLGKDWHYDIPGEGTGECWGIAAHSNGDCEVLSGEYKGRKLSEIWQHEKNIFGKASGEVFPLLIKIIDAKADLSIQVHPDDEYARVHENGSLGKTECWYILDCEENSKLIIGHNAKDKKELQDMILNKKWKEFIREVPVKKGDFIQINPGTLHAIKGGIMLLETQQNSDITYRVYDYDRLADGKPRQLHIEQSIDTINAPAEALESCLLHEKKTAKNEIDILIQNSFYKVMKLEVAENAVLKNEETFICASIIEGSGIINNEEIKKGDHFIIPANSGDLELKGNFKIIYSTVGA